MAELRAFMLAAAVEAGVEIDGELTATTCQSRQLRRGFAGRATDRTNDEACQTGGIDNSITASVMARTTPHTSWYCWPSISHASSAVIGSSSAIKTSSTRSPPAWRLGHLQSPRDRVQTGWGRIPSKRWRFKLHERFQAAPLAAENLFNVAQLT